jgi:C1A family cysteine protease
MTRQNLIIDLRNLLDIVYYQGNLSSCSGNVVAYAYRFLQNKEKVSPNLMIMPSRLFIYYNTRVIGGNVNTDSGGNIANAITSLRRQGVCDESLWDYDPTRVLIRPPALCYNAALKHRVITSNNINLPSNTTQNAVIAPLKNILRAGFPFMLRMRVYESIFTPNTKTPGLIKFPIPSGDRFLGFHYIICLGFNDKEGFFILRNSWGQGNGDGGDYYMPYGYLASGYTARTTGIQVDQITLITRIQDTL